MFDYRLGYAYMYTIHVRMHVPSCHALCPAMCTPTHMYACTCIAYAYMCIYIYIVYTRMYTTWPIHSLLTASLYSVGELGFRI